MFVYSGLAMNIKLQIDLRKADPLGLDLGTSADAAKAAYQRAKDLGPGDQTKPGWYPHNQAFQASLSEARRLHGLLRIIAAMVGVRAAFIMPELNWAVTRDFSGDVRPETVENTFDVLFANMVAGVGVEGVAL